MNWNDIPDEEWEKSSFAVIANRHGTGCVVWYGGGATLRFEIEEVCGALGLDDLGLDDAPEGISIWEGCYVATQIHGYEGTPDVVTRPVGKFRRPHKSEWRAIRANENPFDPRDASERAFDAADDASKSEEESNGTKC